MTYYWIGKHDKRAEHNGISLSRISVLNCDMIEDFYNFQNHQHDIEKDKRFKLIFITFFLKFNHAKPNKSNREQRSNKVWNAMKDKFIHFLFRCLSFYPCAFWLANKREGIFHKKRQSKQNLQSRLFPTSKLLPLLFPRR